MNAPGLPNAKPKPPLGDGGVATGSGKVERPWLRMHRDMASILSLSCSDACLPPGPPPGSNLKHELCADWNAGD